MPVTALSTKKPSLEVAPITLATFFFCDLELYHLTLSYKWDLAAGNHDIPNTQVKGHFVRKLLSGHNTHTHTHTTDQLPIKVNGKMAISGHFGSKFSTIITLLTQNVNAKKRNNKKMVTNK